MVRRDSRRLPNASAVRRELLRGAATAGVPIDDGRWIAAAPVMLRMVVEAIYSARRRIQGGLALDCAGWDSRHTSVTCAVHCIN